MKKEEIKNAAYKVKTVYDLLVLLNAIKKDEHPGESYPFTIDQLNYFINPKRSRKHYVTFSIHKRSGGERIISAPVKMLKSIQQCINRLLQAFYEAPANVTGFVPNKSIINNAECHVGMRYVFNTDLKDFFPSIPQARVWGALKSHPFHFPEKVASAIAGLCCIQEEVGRDSSDFIEGKDDFDVKKPVYRYVLPQGSPCSPVLTNIVCHNLDRKLNGLARRFHMHYSRYADDITFSSSDYAYQENGEFMQELRRIIAEQNFSINDNKTRLQKKGERQEVTGLVVSDRVNVTREYIRSLENLLFIWKKYGYDAAFAKFMQHYSSKQKRDRRLPRMEDVIRGRLMYLKMVKGESSPVWKRLNTRFDQLSSSTAGTKGTDIIYTHSYTIEEFEGIFGTEVSLCINGTGSPWHPGPFFTLDGKTHDVFLSKYTKTRLLHVLESGNQEQLRQFKRQFRIAYCHHKHTDEKSSVWLIIRNIPKETGSAVDLSS